MFFTGQIYRRRRGNIPLNPFELRPLAVPVPTARPVIISENIPLIQFSSSPPPHRPVEEIGSGEAGSLNFEEFDELLGKSSSDSDGKKTSGSEDVRQIQSSNILRGADIFYTEEKCRQIDEYLEAFVARMDQTQPELPVSDDEGYHDSGTGHYILVGADSVWEAAQEPAQGTPPLAADEPVAQAQLSSVAATSRVVRGMPTIHPKAGLLIDLENSDDSNYDSGNALIGLKDHIDLEIVDGPKRDSGKTLTEVKNDVNAEDESQSDAPLIHEIPENHDSGNTVNVADDEDRSQSDVVLLHQIPEKYKKMGKENFANCKIRPTPGTIIEENTPFHEFRLCNVNGPGLFYLKDMTNSARRDAMEDEMTKWYHEYFWEKHLTLVPDGNPEGCFEHMLFTVEDGGYYAAFVKDMGKWIRCTAEIIHGLGDENPVLIHLLDHGTQALVPNISILPLRTEYLELPIQAYVGTLKDVDNNSGADIRVDASTAKKFREATEGQDFVVHIIQSEASEYLSMAKLNVVIIGKIHMFKGEMLITEFAVPGYKKVQ